MNDVRVMNDVSYNIKYKTHEIQSLDPTLLCIHNDKNSAAATTGLLGTIHLT